MLQIWFFLLNQKKEWIIQNNDFSLKTLTDIFIGSPCRKMWLNLKHEKWLFSSSAKLLVRVDIFKGFRQNNNKATSYLRLPPQQMTQNQSVLHCREGKLSAAKTLKNNSHIHQSKGSSFMDLIVRVCKSDEVKYPVQEMPSPQLTLYKLEFFLWMYWLLVFSQIFPNTRPGYIWLPLYVTCKEDQCLVYTSYYYHPKQEQPCTYVQGFVLTDIVTRGVRSRGTLLFQETSQQWINTKPVFRGGKLKHETLKKVFMAVKSLMTASGLLQ